MNSSEAVTAIFDIGKTNKKFFLYDRDFSIVHHHQTVIEQQTDSDGYPCEDADALKKWMEAQFSEALNSKQYDVEAVNVSAYGATLVHLNKQGTLVIPVEDYLKPHPEELFDRFLEQCGNSGNFIRETASPPLGMLNSGFQLYRLKYENPEIYRKIAYSLHLPQYIIYLLTGNIFSEPTSVGCHTMLWDFNEQQYHRWIEQEEMIHKFPEVQPVTSHQVSYCEGAILKSGIGIHDSSAALAPYIYLLEEEFILISTGTWSISLNPFSRQPLTDSELERDCLNYIDIHGRNVKASRFFLGGEHDHQTKKLNDHFGSLDINEIEPDIELIRKMAENRDSAKKLCLEASHRSGPFQSDESTEWQVDQFFSYKEAYHQLMLDLVAIQAESLTLALGSSSIKQFVITGGFAQNQLYNRLLATFFPDKEIYRANIPHASALGAAFVVNHDQLDQMELQKLKPLLQMRRCEPFDELNNLSYKWKKEKMY